jgi:hypothetical protein
MSTQTINEQSVICAKPDNLASRLGSQAVILNMEYGRYFGLNTTGAFVWDLVQQPRTVAEIEHGICSEFDVTPEQCRVDVARLLENLLSNGLIEVR